MSIGHRDETAVVPREIRTESSSRGFTLLEILLAIAIIGLIATTIIGASAHLLSDRPAAPDEVFWQAVMAARKDALLSGREVWLTFDVKAKAFAENNGTASKTFPVRAAGDDFAVSFISAQGGSNSSTLIGGTLTETQNLSHVSFYDDGTCTPFRIQIQNKGGAHTLAVDPWTCARVLNPGDAPGTTP